VIYAIDQGVTLRIPTSEATFGGGDSTASRLPSTMDEGDVKMNLNAYKAQISPNI
jgi:hypothetical protein